MASMTTARTTRRQFLRSTALTAGAAAAFLRGARVRPAAPARLLVLPVPEVE